MKKQLFWQLYPLYLLTILVSLAAVAWYASSTVRDYYLKQTAEDLEAEAHIAASHVAEFSELGEASKLNPLYTELGKKTGSRITVILKNGTVICDSEEDPARMENHANRPEIVEALDGKTGIATRHSFTLGKDMMYVAIPIEREGAIEGVFRVSLPITAVNEALASIYMEIAFGGLAIAIFAAVICLFISRRISVPLQNLKNGAERFAAGDLGHRLEAPVTLEFDTLAEAMNQMAGRLDERIKTVIHQRNEQEAMLDSMVEGVMAVDVDERLIHMNDACASMIGIEPGTGEGRTLQEITRNSELHRLISSTLGRASNAEGELVLGEDRNCFVQAHVTSLIGEEGNKIGAMVVLNDVTRLKRLENIRREFVANVSHELKTPITSIKGFIETLLTGALDSREEAIRFLRIVAKHSDRLEAIINDLLALSRIEQESERKEVYLKDEAIHTVLDSAAVLCGDKAAEKKIRINVECDPDIKAKINKRLLEQAVVNLLDNAVKYSKEDGTVHVRGEERQGEVFISVEDQGTGIPEEHLSRLFERFYRVDKARSREMGGTGLGLAIVKHIMQSHGGHVDVQSELDVGSTFSLHLPSKEDEAS